MGDLLGLSRRVIVVAGAGGGGIGTSVCAVLAQAGARVVALDVDAARLAAAEPYAWRTAVVDLTDAAAAARVIGGLGPLDGLVQVAGGVGLDQWQPTDRLRLGDVERVFELNFVVALHTAQLVVAQFAPSRGGSVVFVSSVAAMVASPFTAHYAAAKAALLSLVQSAAVEWGPRGVRVNAVAPGSIRTARKLELGSTADDSAIERAAIPLGRRGRPDEIAGAALYLLSDLASFVSGQVIAVDGASSADR